MTDKNESDWPLYAAEGMPKGELTDWRLRIDGLVEETLEVSLEDLKKLPREVKSMRLSSATGWSVRAEWEGVPMKEILKLVKLKPEASHVKFYSAGGRTVYTSTVELKDMEYRNAMFVYGVNGRPLTHKDGGPARPLFPHLWGYKSVKWPVRMEFTDRMEPGYWESRGYDLDGRIPPGTILDINTGRRRQIKGGEITEF
ncbi:MAG: sulfite oxidase-like oxidoreductase [Planctomycetota bacterium]|nr:MAG: sulfite oxidase-like oxidoreductase [Planctomycetota bacterium]